MKHKPLRLRVATGEPRGLGRNIEVVSPTDIEVIAWWDYELRSWILLSSVLLSLLRPAMERGDVEVAASIKGTARKWLKEQGVLK